MGYHGDHHHRSAHRLQIRFGNRYEAVTLSYRAGLGVDRDGSHSMDDLSVLVQTIHFLGPEEERASGQSEAMTRISSRWFIPNFLTCFLLVATVASSSSSSFSFVLV